MRTSWEETAITKRTFLNCRQEYFGPGPFGGIGDSGNLRKGIEVRKLRMLLGASVFLYGWADVAMAAPPETVTLVVKNMTWELSPVTMKKAFEKVLGVSTMRVDFDMKTATVSFHPEKAKVEMMTKATTEAGYPSVIERSEMADVFLQSVLTCPYCQYTGEETMPTDACLYFYTCLHCYTLLRP